MFSSKCPTWSHLREVEPSSLFYPVSANKKQTKQRNVRALGRDTLREGRGEE